eukprot:720486-Prymnesium_polylepis.1
MAPISRSLTASEVVMLAKDIDRTSRSLHDIKCVVVCVHVIIHGVMNLTLAVGDARCTASMHGEVTVTAGPASAAMALLVKSLVLDPMIAISTDARLGREAIVDIADVAKCFESVNLDMLDRMS